MGLARADRTAGRLLDAEVRFTDTANKLLRRIREDHGSLFLLIDDTGCCGPGNVFLQTERPGEPYATAGTSVGLEIRIHPAFHGGRHEDEFVIDAQAATTDDSFSLETRYGYRFILHLDRRVARGGIGEATSRA